MASFESIGNRRIGGGDGAGTGSAAKDHRCNLARHLSSLVSNYTKTN